MSKILLKLFSWKRVNNCISLKNTVESRGSIKVILLKLVSVFYVLQKILYIFANRNFLIKSRNNTISKQSLIFLLRSVHRYSLVAMHSNLVLWLLAILKKATLQSLITLGSLILNIATYRKCCVSWFKPIWTLYHFLDWSFHSTYLL